MLDIILNYILKDQTRFSRRKAIKTVGSAALLGSIISSNREAYTYLPNSVDNFMTAGQLSTLMQSIGLEDVSFSKMGFGTVALHVGVKPH